METNTDITTEKVATDNPKEDEEGNVNAVDVNETSTENVQKIQITAEDPITQSQSGMSKIQILNPDGTVTSALRKSAISNSSGASSGGSQVKLVASSGGVSTLYWSIRPTHSHGQ